MSVLTLAASLTTSNVPWFTDLTVSMQQCSLQNGASLTSPDTSPADTTSALAQPFHFSWSYFSALFRKHTGHLPTWAFIFQYHIFLPFHTVHEVLKSRMLTWFAIPFSSGPHFVRTLHDPAILGDPYRAWLIVSLSYTRLWLIWSFWLVFCDCGFHSLCLLMDENKRLVQAHWRERLKVGPQRIWVMKNRCFGTVVLKKTLEGPLDYKEIKPIHPKGNQPRIFTGRTDAAV